MFTDWKKWLQKEIANDCRLQKAIAKCNCKKWLHKQIAKSDCKWLLKAIAKSDCKWLQKLLGNEMSKRFQSHVLIDLKYCKAIAYWKVIAYCKWLQTRGHGFFNILFKW